MDNVEVMSIKNPHSNGRENLCNQCRPADGTYAYQAMVNTILATIKAGQDIQNRRMIVKSYFTLNEPIKS